MRLADVQTWPLFRKRAHAAPGTATSRSASSNTISGSMPPSSRFTRFNCSAARTAILVPTAVDPVNAMHATSRVVHQRRAGLRSAGDHVDDAVRQVRQRPLDQPQRRQRRQLRGLDDDGVAGGQRRRDLPAEEQQRVVERHDGRDDAERLLDGEVDLMFGRRRDRRAVRVARDLRVVLEAGRRPLDLVEVLDARLAAFERQQLRQLRAVLAHQAARFRAAACRARAPAGAASAAAPLPPSRTRAARRLESCPAVPRAPRASQEFTIRRDEDMGRLLRKGQGAGCRVQGTVGRGFSPGKRGSGQGSAPRFTARVRAGRRTRRLRRRKNPRHSYSPVPLVGSPLPTFGARIGKRPLENIAMSRLSA